MVSGEDPFANLKIFEIPLAVEKGQRPVVPAHVPAEYSALMIRAWHNVPTERPTMAELCASFEEMYSRVKK